MNVQAMIPSKKFKTDMVYYTAFAEEGRFVNAKISMQILKAIAFIVLIPINLITLNVAYGNIIIAFILNLVASLVGLVHLISVNMVVYRSVMTYLTIAVETHHIIDTDPVTDLTSIDNCVSLEIYVAEGKLKIQDLTDDLRKLNLTIAKTTLNQQIDKSFPRIRSIENIYGLYSLTTMIFSIYVLATESMAPINIAILSIYIAVVTIAQFVLVLGCIAVALAPVICLVLCILCCCCCGNTSANKFIGLPAKQAQPSDLINAEGNCSICFMNFALKQKIYVLPCSQKHIYHCQCLRQWVKMKNTCPLCRAQIPMTNHQDGQPSEQNRESPLLVE